MNLLEILRECDPAIEMAYNSNNYRDMRKKLIVAFECLGLYNLDVFKSESGTDYDFMESSKEYIVYLMNDDEIRDLFRHIKSDRMSMEDYARLAHEIDKLFVFIKPYMKTDEEYKRIISEISLNTRYPIIKRFAENQHIYHSFRIYYESLVKGDGYATTFSDWLFLTMDDQIELFDELTTATRKCVEMVEKRCEFRADEVMEGIDNISVDDVLTYALVNEKITEEFCEKYEKLFPENERKARSIRSAISKEKTRLKASNKLKLDLAKQCCDEYNIDFQQYLSEQKKIEEMEPEQVSTEEAIKAITNADN